MKMGKMIGYAVIRERGERPSLSTLVGTTREEGEAILVVARMDYPALHENARVVELHEIEEASNAPLRP
jgi:hypothetical protein